MSKQRARKRAEERARKRAPKSHATDASAAPRVKKAYKRSAREQRHRRRIWTIGIVWLVSNVLIAVIFRTWEALWVGLTITTILVPLVVWLVWDPEGRVDL